MEKACNFLESINKNETIEKIEEIDLTTYICDNTDGILDPLDQITFGMNEVQVTYGNVVVLKDAPWWRMSPPSSSDKNPIEDDKADEVKALVSRYMLLKIEQRKIENKLNEVIKYYDTESLRIIFEPIGDSIMGTIGLELPHRKKEKDISQNQIWREAYLACICPKYLYTIFWDIIIKFLEDIKAYYLGFI